MAIDSVSKHCHLRAPQLGEPVIMMCDEGHQPRLAAARLPQLGFARATDVEGGFQG